MGFVGRRTAKCACGSDQRLCCGQVDPAQSTPACKWPSGAQQAGGPIDPGIVCGGAILRPPAFGELSQAKERLEELNIDLGWVGTGTQLRE